MSFSAEVMASSAENGSIIHLDAPILPDKADVSNMTIIRTGTGAILEDQFFLNTVVARVVSGIFVWTALLITGHQVSLSHGPIPRKLQSLQHQEVLSSGASKLSPGFAVVPPPPCYRTESSSLFPFAPSTAVIKQISGSYLFSPRPHQRSAFQGRKVRFLI